MRMSCRSADRAAPPWPFAWTGTECTFAVSLLNELYSPYAVGKQNHVFCCRAKMSLGLPVENPVPALNFLPAASCFHILFWFHGVRSILKERDFLNAGVLSLMDLLPRYPRGGNWEMKCSPGRCRFGGHHSWAHLSSATIESFWLEVIESNR